MARVLIAGCGDVGTALGVRLQADGHTVWGMRRHTATLPASIQPLAADLTLPATLRALPRSLDWIVYAAAADTAAVAAYQAAYVDGMRNLLDALALQHQQPLRFVFTSSTSVYGQTDGEWVDEESPTAPLEYSGRIMLAAERLLLAAPFPVTVLRLGGIYGVGRTRLLESVRRGTAVRYQGPPRYTNRIHRDDAVGVIRHLLAMSNPETMYLGVDHEAADHNDVVCWLAQQLGVPTPPIESALSARSSKRCRNARLIAAGYVFLYPTFRQGYAALAQ